MDMHQACEHSNSTISKVLTVIKWQIITTLSRKLLKKQRVVSILSILESSEHFPVLWAFCRVVSILDSCEHFAELWGIFRVVSIFQSCEHFAELWAFFRAVSILQSCEHLQSCENLQVLHAFARVCFQKQCALASSVFKTPIVLLSRRQSTTSMTCSNSTGYCKCTQYQCN